MVKIQALGSLPPGIKLIIYVALALARVADGYADEVVAVLYSKEGIVEAQRKGSTDWVPVEVNSEFRSQDAVRVGREGRAGIAFQTGNFVRLSNNALLRFTTDAQGNEVLEQPEGNSFFFSRKEKEYPLIKTPLVSAAVRGTEFAVLVEPASTQVAVMQGQVELSNNYGTVALAKGEQAITEAGKAPQKSILVNPIDAVQWALNYPILSADGAILSTSALAPAVKTLSVAQQNLRFGSLDSALSELAEAERATARISAPEAESMRALIYAQRSIISIVKNDVAGAETELAGAAKHTLTTAGVALASSYVNQARGDIEAARSAIDAALKYQPGRADLWARMAELELAFNEVENAQAAVLKAIELNPNDAYAHAVRGFVLLFMREYGLARDSMLKAISLDSSLALARLGLGLLFTQEGQSEQGIAEFEKAVVLQPQAGIYRSYLGKGFFENEDEKSARAEYELAISLDPQDPTPFLYRGFLNLSQNQPVAALDDIEQSIALNEGRAVYRSRLLLDQDLGVRSAGLARIFDALDFNEVSRLEAIKSIYKDYRNYSAHRLLSESQDTVFLADAAFSERRIADVLSPLSFNLFNSIGGEASFNDYDALFDKDENRTGFNGIYDGRDEIYSGEAFQAGKSGDFGYFVTASSDFADGTKHNDFLRDYRMAINGQYQPTWQDRIAVEGEGQVREQDARGGSPQQSDFIGGELGVSYNRRIDSSSTFVGEVRMSDNSSFSRDLTVLPIAVSESSFFSEEIIDDEALINEYLSDDLFGVRTSMQYLYSSPIVSFVAGAQALNQKADRSEDGLIVDDSAGLFSGLGHYLETRGENDLNSYDVFLYTIPHPFSWLDLDIGASASFLELEDREITPFLDGTSHIDHLNPKLGLLVYPASWATIRGGYFETVRKSSLEDQSALEPTMVGGLNQRFNDLSGSQSRNLGLGLDIKVAGSSYFGAEWTKRHVIEPSFGAIHAVETDFVALTEETGFIDSGYSDEHLDQHIVRSYWYQVLSDSLVSTFDYQYTAQTRTDPDFPQEFDNHRFRIGARYFHSSGFFAFSKATWRYQDLQQSFFFEDGTESFWILDAGIGYRLPKRHGTVSLEFNNIGNHSFEYDNSLGFDEFTAQEFAVRLVASVNF